MNAPPPEVLILGSFPDWYFERLSQGLRPHFYNAAKDKEALITECAPSVNILVTDGPVDNTMLAKLPNLKAIVSMASGFEKVDLEALRKRGIQISNIQGVNDDCVADMAWALLLAVGRHVLRGDRHLRSGDWLKGMYPLVPKVSGKRLGILGLGGIGRAVARRGEAFNMNIAYHTRNKRPDTSYRYYSRLIDLAADSDFLVVTVPGGSATYHMVNAEVLAALGSKGVIVNVGRGSTIDEAALVEALKSGALGGAGLDVYEFEPCLPNELAALDNVVLMPHRGGSTVETYLATCDATRENIFAFLNEGRIRTPVPGTGGSSTTAMSEVLP